MCGRFVGSYDATRLADEIGDAFAGLDLARIGTDPVIDSHNVAPTTYVPALVARDGTVSLERVHWGLVPTWSRDPSRASSMINARIETVTEKPSFRGLLASHRCVVPMNGFYEWRRPEGGPGIPHYVTREDGLLMLVAGVWTTSPALDGAMSMAMFTEESTGTLAAIHHRAPVEVDLETAREWLADSRTGVEDLVTAPRPPLQLRRVSTRVNSVRNDDPGLIEPDDGTGTERGQPTLF